MDTPNPPAAKRRPLGWGAPALASLVASSLCAALSAQQSSTSLPPRPPASPRMLNPPSGPEFSGAGNQILPERVLHGQPIYEANENAEVRAAVGVNEVAPGGIWGYGLTGAGVRIGLWEVGAIPLLSHAELSSRLVLPTYVLPQIAPASDHATHVAGTLGASGVDPLALGMAPGATIEVFTAAGDEFEMNIAAAATGLQVSNHSYGLVCGWHVITDELGVPTYSKWYGNVFVSDVEDYKFGLYSDGSRDWDIITWTNPRYLPVVSAGNDRGDAPAPGLPAFVYRPPFGWVPFGTLPGADGASSMGYDTLGSNGHTAKNALVVGAAREMSSRYSGPTSVTLAAFSSCGPTDDGRLKPDLVAPGVDTYSCIAGAAGYGELSGTSMASPAVAGVVALILEHVRVQLGLPTPLAATLKALLIHTASECGSFDGPDYRFGWGLVNAEGAANVVVLAALGDATVLQRPAFDGSPDSYRIYPDGALGSMRITLAYSDRPGAASPAVLDSPVRRLVNDLDVVLERRSSLFGSTFYWPWVLDPAHPAMPATQGDNDLDNVERIDVLQTNLVPLPGETLEWWVHVNAETFSPSTPLVQPYALVITGARR